MLSVEPRFGQGVKQRRELAVRSSAVILLRDYGGELDRRYRKC
jgi:hypothetical protein